MKILFIGHERELNGASKSLLNIINVLKDNNEIYVLTSFNEGPFYDELCRSDVRILVYPFYRWVVARYSAGGWIKKRILWWCRQRFTNIATAKKISRFIEDEGIEIVHTNTSVINVGFIIRKILKDRIKHICHLREFGDLDFNMYPLTGETLRDRCMNRYTDRFICISGAVCNHYRNLDNDKKTVIYNGVDNSNMIERNENHENVNFLISGRISEAKGQKDAVNACIRLIDEGYKNIKLYLAGSGELYFDIPEKYSEYVVVLGQVSNMPELRKKMDVELVCSKAEAFGRVTAEAMMGGMPVIGSNTGGTPELIMPGHTGYLYEYGNIEDLSDKMKRFAENKSLLAEMSESARKYAADNFTIERCVQEITGIYDSLR